MASSLPTTASVSSSLIAKSTISTPTSSSTSTGIVRLHFHCSRIHSNVSLPTKLRLFARRLESGRNCSIVARAQHNQVSVDGSSNDVAVATPPGRSEIPAVEPKDSLPESKPSSPAFATEESISEFMAQVSSLVKLVNSKDIVELELKQLGCELLIRKKEALPQPTPSPVMMMHSSLPPALAPPDVQAAPLAAAPAPSSPASASVIPATKSVKSSYPPFKCPMAGTFYRCSGPGEPPFVKVGDKVQKGQVICIIEAMKLMNEIEADQAGTVVEVIAEDGKPVSIDTPLFVIQP